MEPKRLQKAINRGAPKSLAEAGRYTWRVVRNSIWQKKNANRHSPPGKPPYAHKASYIGKDGQTKENPGYRKRIVFSNVEKYQNGTESIFIGSLPFGKDMPRIQEFGGIAIVRKIEYPKQWKEGFQIGDIGPVNTKHWSKRKDPIIRTDEHTDPRNQRTVLWIRLRLESQA